jgi:formamidopyrimidine-DNA glycosylase
MPELPEVETVKNGMALGMSGRQIVKIDIRREGLRVPFPPDLAVIKGSAVEHLTRRAKYVLVHLSGGRIMAIHLGMSGRITIMHDIKSYVPAKHDHLIFHLSDGGGVVFNDPRRFGLVYLFGAEEMATHPAFKDIGPEPLSNEFSGPVLREKLKNKSTPIKVALLDQHVVAGVGNIYASEALYLSGINPLKPSRDLNAVMAERLVSAIRTVLDKAIAAGGSTLKDYRRSDGELGYFQHQFSVYGRDGEPCPAARVNGKKGHSIQKIVQGDRATYFCPICQK